MPDWTGLNDAEIAEYVDEIQAATSLSDYERDYLLSRLSFRTGNVYKRPPESTYSMSKRREHKFRKKRLKRRAKQELFWVIRDAQLCVEDCLWESGCLEISSGRWLVTSGSKEEFRGAYWFAQKIWQLIDNLQLANQRNDIGAVARHSFSLGDTIQSMVTQIGHGDFIRKQRETLERQRAAGQATAKGTKKERIELVRHYMLQGVLPTAAATSAAEDFGVSLTTIRKAFPNAWLPRNLDDFPDQE